MTADQVTATANRVNEAVRNINDVMTDTAGITVASIDLVITERVTELRYLVSARQAELILTEAEYINALYYDATYHLTRAYHHASPSLVAIIATIVGILADVWKVVQWVLKILKIIDDLHALGILDDIWPWLDKQYTAMLNKISEFSKDLGWGVDGVLHVLNAVEGFTNVYSALAGKTKQWAWLAKLEQKEAVLKTWSADLQKLQKNPAELIDMVTDRIGLWYYEELNPKRVKVFEVLDTTVNRLEKAGQAADYAITELYKIQTDMPKLVAKYIPKEIWDKLAKVDEFIDSKFLPALEAVDKKLNQYENILAKYQEKMSELADRIAHPGDVLAGVDNLPDYARIDQEKKIDDVASREMARRNAEQWAAMEPNLKEFSKVIAASKAPTPAPGFMTLEIGEGTPAPGITVEPHETWMVGDY